jgi:hypothetical protein
MLDTTALQWNKVAAIAWRIEPQADVALSLKVVKLVAKC